MKHYKMEDPKEKRGSMGIDPSQQPDTAFDRWLNRGLHEMFDDVMKEPVPPELLKIIQDDKKK